MLLNTIHTIGFGMWFPLHLNLGRSTFLIILVLRILTIYKSFDLEKDATLVNYIISCRGKAVPPFRTKHPNKHSSAWQQNNAKVLCYFQQYGLIITFYFVCTLLLPKVLSDISHVPQLLHCALMM